MKWALVLGVFLVLGISLVHSAEDDDDDDEAEEDVDSVGLFQKKGMYVSGTINRREKGTLKDTIQALTRQLLLQQMYVEERTRSDGGSGIKQIRRQFNGPSTYHGQSYTGPSICAIHEHSNNIRTIGMGEFVGVLNGLEFRTRHNDYRLVMPSTKTTGYHAVENIPFPDVPPQVKNKKTVREQIREMKEWFRAFKNQDYSKRDYRKYFKPVLCYLEGAWIQDDDFEESFFSDRHFLDASSWFDMQSKIDFTSYTGRKSQLENYAYLPTRVFDVSNTSIPTPTMGQWNYRILCHPLSKDLPLNRFRLKDDISARMGNKQTLEEYENSRAARFFIDPFNKANNKQEQRIKSNYLDTLMYEIPGKDNYISNIKDDAFGETAQVLLPGRGGPLNAARYHRWYKVTRKGAMGLQVRTRGFSDSNLFVAMNTQEKIMPKTLKECRSTGKGKYKKTECKTYTQRVSYAIPMEIIYMTPLSKWNPYNLQFKGKPYSDWGKTVQAGGRNGGLTKDKAYNGLNEKVFYQTPSEFFTGKTVQRDAADTAQSDVGVLDRNKNVRKVRSSGHRILLPDIEGIGRIRQRYPIMPVHAEDGAIWKAFDALKDIVLEPKKYTRYLREKNHNNNGNDNDNDDDDNDDNKGQNEPKGFNGGKFLTSPAAGTNNHRHSIILTVGQYNRLAQGKNVSVLTEQADGHNHQLLIQGNKDKSGAVINLRYIKCDSKTTLCHDRHARPIIKDSDGRGNDKDDDDDKDDDKKPPAGYNAGKFITSAARDGHEHPVKLTVAQYNSLMAGRNITLFTQIAHGHRHHLLIQSLKAQNGGRYFRYVKCDYKTALCGDGHLRAIKRDFGKDDDDDDKDDGHDHNHGHNHGGNNSPKLPAGFNNGKFQTGWSTTNKHRHAINLKLDDYNKLLDGKEVVVKTEMANNHHHWMRLQRVKNDAGNYYIKYIKCDGQSMCKDLHTRVVSKVMSSGH